MRPLKGPKIHVKINDEREIQKAKSEKLKFQKFEALPKARVAPRKEKANFSLFSLMYCFQGFTKFKIINVLYIVSLLSGLYSHSKLLFL